MNITCSVQARLGSTRLPGKVLYTLQDKRILELVVRRSKESSTVDQTCIAVGNEPENDAIIGLCDRKDFTYLQGPEEDLVTRHKRVADYTDCDVLCRITGDCPFVASSEINRTVKEHLNNDADYTTNKGEKMPIGLAVDVFDRETIEVLCQDGETHPVEPLQENASEWDIRYTHENKWKKYHDVHTAVDTPKDYWRLTDAVKTVGTSPTAVTEWMSKQNW